MGRLTSLDDKVRELLGSEHDVDLQKCEEYKESANHAIIQTSHQMRRHVVTSTTNVTITDACKAAAVVAPIAPSAMIKFFLIKLDPVSEDIETWARF